MDAAGATDAPARAPASNRRRPRMKRDRPLLVGWNRSPYTRRVAISMYVYGIDFEQRARTAWDHYDDVRRFNPIV